MTCSAARLEANRRNASLSTGPKTAEGKARSRANALKHGMAGEGIALPNEDAAEVTRRFETLGVELAPGDEMGRILVRRIALNSVRMERAARHEAAALSERVRHAEEAFDDRMAREVEVLARGSGDGSATNARRLRTTVAGIDWMLGKWEVLRSDLDNDRWGCDHASLAEDLMGFERGPVGVSRVRAFDEAIDGRSLALDEADGAGLGGEDLGAWAVRAMGDLIEAQVEDLRRARSAIDVEEVARDRAGAADRAMFDDSPKAILARRYEAAAVREMYRALRALKEHVPAAIEAEDEAAPVVAEEVAPAGPLGSSRTAEPAAPVIARDRVANPAAAASAFELLGSAGPRGDSRGDRAWARADDVLDFVVGRATAPASPVVARR